MRNRSLPNETINRLFSYFRPLMCFAKEGRETILSQELADLCDVHPSLVRKDFSYLGNLGTRGVGYKVSDLMESIRTTLGMNKGTRVAVVGIGNIGRALLEHKGFQFEGFSILHAFDNDPEKIGQTISGVTVEDVKDLKERILSENIEMVILAVSEMSAPVVAKRVAGFGVTSILSFCPCKIAMPNDVKVTCIDLSMAMARLVYYSCLSAEGQSDSEQVDQTTNEVTA